MIHVLSLKYLLVLMNTKLHSKPCCKLITNVSELMIILAKSWHKQFGGTPHLIWILKFPL